MRLLFVFLSCILISCGSLQLPEYRRPAATAKAKPYRPSPHSSHVMELSWPTKGGRFSRGFKTNGRPHLGIDIAKPVGSPIYAAHSGRVVYTGSRHYRGFGKLIILEHPSGWGSMYAHLDSYSVREGDWVERGQKIARIGMTGRTTGAHLHFELRKHKKPVDPLKYLP
tara:strand:- start:2535 stop:3038 length:504 start_codon:yes stop_codon:yes gene_type:complete